MLIRTLTIFINEDIQGLLYGDTKIYYKKKLNSVISLNY